MTRILGLEGQRFGRLVIESRAADSSSGETRWIVVCDCGTRKSALGRSIRSGHTKSCGCLITEQMMALNATKRTHGMKKTRAYKTWEGMRGRCRNPNDKQFKNYGARGISVCDRWINSFENFFEDMGHPPPRMTLDRKNNDGNYEPSNCRWATATEQTNNKRNNRFLEFEGRRMTAAQWAREAGISRSRLFARMQSGWSIEKALSTPTGRHGARP